MARGSLKDVIPTAATIANFTITTPPEATPLRKVMTDLECLLREDDPKASQQLKCANILDDPVHLRMP